MGNSVKNSLDLFINLFRANMTLQRKLNKSCNSLGVTLSQFAVLEALNTKGDLSVGEIKESILTTSGNITVVISNLEKEGFVKRFKSKKDKRSYIISITDEGKEVVKEIFPDQEKIIVDIFSHIDEDMKKQMIIELNKIWKNR